MDNDAQACLFFSYCYGVGPYAFLKLREHFETPLKAYEASGNKLKKIVSPSVVEKITTYKNVFNFKKVLQELELKKVGYVAFSDDTYPDQLRHIADPPIGLFYRGNWNGIQWEQEKMFGIVGTRSPTFYGKTSAQTFARALENSGMTIVSGMALGIDTCAHLGALGNNGKTVAVLGCGVDIVYPSENVRLYERIVNGGGVVLSEFVPGQTVLRGLFVARNRIISGLSWGVLVVEGAEKSGSLITARYAAEQGRELFALPGQSGMVQAQAPLLLLKEGARMALTPSDIIEGAYAPSSSGVAALESLKKQLNPAQLRIVTILQGTPLSTDDMVGELGLDIATLSTELVMLELMGVVGKTNEGTWSFKINI